MKKFLSVLVVVIHSFLIIPCKTLAQGNDSNAGFDVNMDIYSTYVWRGVKYGQGPHFQPEMVFTAGGFTAGIWGSVDFNGYSEADPYISWTFPFGLSLGLTDYYYPGLPFLNTSVTAGSHAFEMNCNYSAGGLNLSANYIFNEAGGAGSAGSDLYFEAGYSFDKFNIFAGAGNGWHTSDGNFNICNIGLGTEKQIEITEKFSLSLAAQVIYNPDMDRLFLVAGISF